MRRMKAANILLIWHWHTLCYKIFDQDDRDQLIIFQSVHLIGCLLDHEAESA